MSYAVFILRRAQKEMVQLSIEPYERVLEAIRGLAEDPRPSGCLKLTGREGWRIRVGRYRVIYDVDDAERTITVLHVGHRRDVYG